MCGLKDVSDLFECSAVGWPTVIRVEGVEKQICGVKIRLYFIPIVNNL